MIDYHPRLLVLFGQTLALRQSPRRTASPAPGTPAPHIACSLPAV